VRTYTNATKKGYVRVGGEVVVSGQEPGAKFYTERHRIIEASTGKVYPFDGHPDISDGDRRGGGGQAAIAHDPFTKLLGKLVLYAAILGLAGACLLPLIPTNLAPDDVAISESPETPSIMEGICFWGLVLAAILSVVSVWVGAQFVIPHSARVPRK